MSARQMLSAGLGGVAPGDAWGPRFYQNDFEGVAWNGSLYVAVGQYGSADYSPFATSTDGQVWYPRKAAALPSTTAPRLYDVIWASTQFVAVGQSGKIFTSSDGFVWTQRTTTTAQTFNAVAWSGSVLVACGDGGVIFTSPDGVTWTQRSSGTTLSNNAVTWNGSLFVVVGASGNIRTSPDGITWTARTSGTSSPLNAVAWSGTVLCAVGANVILTSPDGVTWTARTPWTATTQINLVWAGNKFVSFAFSGETATSPDGITWTVRGTVGYLMNGVVWTGTQLVLAGRGARIFTSADGITWVQRNKNPGDGQFRDVCWGGGQFVAMGYDYAATSPDGVTWTKVYPLPASGWETVIWASGLNLYVAVGENGNIMTSPNGSTWTLRTSGTTQFLSGIVWTGTQLVVSGGAILTSPDGVTWTVRVATVAGGGTLSLAWNGSLLVNVGGTTIQTSPNGITWTARTNPSGADLYSVIWNGVAFVAVGGAGAVLTSPDGITWTARTSGASGENFQGLAASGTLVVGSTNAGNAYISRDNGVTWVGPRPFEPNANAAWGGAYNGQMFVFGANNGGLMLSPPPYATTP